MLAVLSSGTIADITHSAIVGAVTSLVIYGNWALVAGRAYFTMCHRVFIRQYLGKGHSITQKKRHMNKYLQHVL